MAVGRSRRVRGADLTRSWVVPDAWRGSDAQEPRLWADPPAGADVGPYQRGRAREIDELGWTGWIRRQHQELNRWYFGGQLSDPVIELADMLSERVADFAWRHGDPQMRFNRLTVHDVPFLSEEYAGSLARARLAEAVRHETAHQVAAEIHGQPPTGDQDVDRGHAFQLAASQLGGARATDVRVAVALMNVPAPSPHPARGGIHHGQHRDPAARCWSCPPAAGAGSATARAGCGASGRAGGDPAPG